MPPHPETQPKLRALFDALSDAERRRWVLVEIGARGHNCDRGARIDLAIARYVAGKRDWFRIILDDEQRYETEIARALSVYRREMLPCP